MSRWGVAGAGRRHKNCAERSGSVLTPDTERLYTVPTSRWPGLSASSAAPGARRPIGTSAIPAQDLPLGGFSRAACKASTQALSEKVLILANAPFLRRRRPLEPKTSMPLRRRWCMKSAVSLSALASPRSCSAIARSVRSVWYSFLGSLIRATISACGGSTGEIETLIQNSAGRGWRAGESCSGNAIAAVVATRIPPKIPVDQTAPRDRMAASSARETEPAAGWNPRPFTGLSRPHRGMESGMDCPPVSPHSSAHCCAVDFWPVPSALRLRADSLHEERRIAAGGIMDRW